LLLAHRFLINIASISDYLTDLSPSPSVVLCVYVCVCVCVRRSVCPESVLWQYGWLDLDAV